MKKNTGILIGSLLAVILCVGLWFAFVRNKQFNDSNIIDPGEELIISGTLEIGKDLYPGTYDLEYFDTEDAQIYLYETRDGQKKAISFTLKEPVAQNIELENGNVLDLERSGCQVLPHKIEEQERKKSGAVIMFRIFCNALFINYRQKKANLFA